VFFQATRDDILENLMNVLAQIKIINSGIPSDVDPVDYIRQLNEESGFNLTVEDFENPSAAMRAVAKLFMVIIRPYMFTHSHFRGLKNSRGGVDFLVHILESKDFFIQHFFIFHRYR
jgi:hypothetical protein